MSLSPWWFLSALRTRVPQKTERRTRLLEEFPWLFGTVDEEIGSRTIITVYTPTVEHLELTTTEDGFPSIYVLSGKETEEGLDGLRVWWVSSSKYANLLEALEVDIKTGRSPQAFAVRFQAHHHRRIMTHLIVFRPKGESLVELVQKALKKKK